MAKITCGICKKWSGHLILGHLKEAHPRMEVFEYAQKFGEVASPEGYEKLRQMKPKSMTISRPKTQQAVWEIFGLSKWDGKDPTRKWVNATINVFDSPVASTPRVDESYIFDERALRRFLLAMSLPERNRPWIYGYAGVGKTELPKQVAARTNYGYTRIPGDKMSSRRHILGDWAVGPDKTMKFQYGVLPLAMMNGDLTVLDEADGFEPGLWNVFRPVLEDNPILSILENAGERIVPNEDWRICATANTSGAGDESGLFVTANVNSVADRQRFSVWIKLDYLPPAKESEMIKKRFPDLTQTEIRRFHQVVRAVREKHKSGELEESFSPRELINWVEKYTLLGDEMEAASMCFLERYTSPAVQIAVSELIKAAFDEHQQPENIPGDEDEG